MNLLDPRSWFRREAKHSATGAVISAWNVGTPVWTPRRYDRLADEAYVRNAIGYRCARLIAGSAATVHWLLYDKRGNEIESHALLDLLVRPGAMVGGASLFEAFYTYLVLSGNAYLEAVGPDNGAPKELWSPRSDRMRIVPGPYGLPQGYEYEANGTKKVWACDPLTGDGPILHVKEFHPIDDWYGLSRVEPGAYGIDRNNAASAHNKALLDNGARPSGALVFKPIENPDKSKQTAPEPVIAKAEKALLDRHGGPENAGRPLVLGGNVDWLDMGISPKDMDFGHGKDDAARDICAAFGVPHVLVVKGESTYNNLATAKLDLYEETVLPLVDKVLDALNAWLAPKFGDDLRLSVDLDEIPALEPRRESKRTTIISLLDKGVIDDEEAREALQYGPRRAGSLKKIDASVLAGLISAVPEVGMEPLARYLKSVGLIDASMTDEQIMEAADRASYRDDDEPDDVLPDPDAKAAKKTLYVSRPLLNAGEFIAWAKGQGFAKTVPADELHVTLAYSRRAVAWEKIEPATDTVVVKASKNRTVEPLGDQGSVVLLFKSSGLQKRWQEFRTAGASWDHPGYRPHVSITYDGSKVDLEAVEPFAGELRFGPEAFAEVDDDWSEKVTEE